MALARRFLSNLFFSDMTPVIRLGATRSLLEEDLPALPRELSPEAEVLAESRIVWTSGKRLRWSLVRATGRLWAIPFCYYMFSAAVTLTGPILVHAFLSHLEAGVSETPALLETLAIGLSIGLSGIISGMAMQHYYHAALRRAQILVNVLNGKIFRHALTLNKASREQTPIGDLVNHLGSDTDAVADVSNALGDLIYCLVMIAGVVGLMFYYLGTTAWAAVGLLMVLGPITQRVSRRYTRYDEELMRQRDYRVSLMSQVLGAIRLVKYFAWEESVAREVDGVRRLELESRRKIARTELLVTVIYVSVGTFVLFAVFALHSWRGFHFDAALIFTCVSLFGLLEDPFAFISRVLSAFVQARVASDRIARFLAQPTVSGSAETTTFAPRFEVCGLEIKDLSVAFSTDAPLALNTLSLHLEAGQSLAVVGAVGAGKSTLLHAILNEVPRVSGQIEFTGVGEFKRDTCRIGYVPQEAYILNATLRENLVFGNPSITTEAIYRALELAGFLTDVQNLSGGLNTEIGEKGVNLSGGQRQRVSLARAILHQPELVLLDDPLSAVDVATESNLVHHLIFGAWRTLTRVVVTHRLTHLAHFDQIAFIKDGRLLAQGNFTEMRTRCPEFRAYLEEYTRTHSGGTNDIAEAPEGKAAPTQSALEGTRITDDEDRQYGAVRGSVYMDYVRSLGGENLRWRPLVLLMLVLATASGTLVPLLQKSWLAYMSNAQAGQAMYGEVLSRYARQPLIAIYIYGLLGLVVLLSALAADLFWLRRGLRAGKDIHDQMLSAILKARIRFFDATPVGRVLQRFSRDMEAIDTQLQWSFENSMKCFVQVLITLTMLVVALPWLVLGIAPVLYLYYRAQALYRASAREVKRLDSIARSPRYAHFKETLQGLVVIRAFNRRDWFLREFNQRLKHSQRMFHGHYMVNRWFSSRIPIIGGVVSLSTATAIVFAVRAGQLSPGVAGLLTVYSLSFWSVLNWGIRIWSEVEARMTSMERVKYYSRVEGEVSVRRSASVPEHWPIHGEVRFENVSLRYADHLPRVLHGLTFRVPGGSRAGIIGRTGSGKSTIFQALYRFVDLEAGHILIDDVDIASIPLARLRRALAIIPQDPTLFMGTLRSNLDRLNEFDDQKLWDVLERTSLAEMVRAEPLGLLTQMAENGANFSQGQRQLLCLARALLLEAKVIILDEATANVDVQTDAQVQRVLRESGRGITMLMIAHRLGTVRDCDQILEIAEGRLRLRANGRGLGVSRDLQSQ